jgi:hypothetical protein
VLTPRVPASSPGTRPRAGCQRASPACPERSRGERSRRAGLRTPCTRGAARSLGQDGRLNGCQTVQGTQDDRHRCGGAGQITLNGESGYLLIEACTACPACPERSRGEQRRRECSECATNGLGGQDQCLIRRSATLAGGKQLAHSLNACLDLGQERAVSSASQPMVSSFTLHRHRLGIRLRCLDPTVPMSVRLVAGCQASRPAASYGAECWVGWPMTALHLLSRDTFTVMQWSRRRAGRTRGGGSGLAWLHEVEVAVADG